MARTGLFHHVGTFLLFAASILLLITTISAPVIKDISILKVTLTNSSNARHSSVTFGTFGHCVLDVAPKETDQDWCTGRHIGYDPAAIMEQIDGGDFNYASAESTKGLTRVMVLHPVACALAFIAFLCALGSGICGALLAALVAALAWIVTLVVMAVDFALFGIIKNHVNKDGSGSHAYYSVGMWTILAAMVCLFFGMFVVLFTCFSARRHRNDARVSKHADAGYANGTTVHKRRFWQRRRNAY